METTESQQGCGAPLGKANPLREREWFKSKAGCGEFSLVLGSSVISAENQHVLT